MFIPSKQLALALFGALASGLFSAAGAQTIGILNCPTTPSGCNSVSAGDFTFTNFRTQQTDTNWLNFSVSASLVDNNPVLTLSGTLSTAGTYALDYQVSGPVNRGFYAQTVTQTGTVTTTTNIYDSFVRNNSIGLAANNTSEPVELTKDGLPTAYATTEVAITSGTFSGLNGTYQPVPWETDVLPLAAATVLFGGGVWLKRRLAQKSMAAEPPRQADACHPSTGGELQ